MFLSDRSSFNTTFTYKRSETPITGGALATKAGRV
jgi:hypothetical protein